MKILGIDFTSSPKANKPLTCVRCALEGTTLHFDRLECWPGFEQFEDVLKEPGPWIAGVDFPFGQSRTFIENIGWPNDWAGYVAYAASFDREGFCKALNDYKKPRRKGDKEHRRATDKAAGSISSQKLYGVPVGKMFFEGAPRLLRSGVTIPVLLSGDPERIVVEAYPGVLARHLIGRVSYKNDTRKKQTEALLAARIKIVDEILGGKLEEKFGFHVEAERNLADDPSGDQLDALLCAIQAAWAWTQRESGYGAPLDTDPLEGWIADPGLRKINANMQKI